MDSKGNIYRIDEDGNKELFEVVAKAQQDEKNDFEEPVILVNRHQRRKRAKLARLEEKKAIAERRKAKG